MSAAQRWLALFPAPETARHSPRKAVNWPEHELAWWGA